MSGSYSQLNAKYNTLYALYLQLQAQIGGSDTLADVLTAGNTADNTIVLTDGTLQGSLTKTECAFIQPTGTSTYGESANLVGADSSLILDLNGVAYSKNYVFPVPYTLSSQLTDSQLQFTDNNGFVGHLSSNELLLTNGTVSATLTDIDLTIDDGTNTSILGTQSLQFPTTASYSNIINLAYPGIPDLFQINPKIVSSCTETGNGGGDVIRMEYLTSVGTPSLFVVNQNTLLDEGTVELQMSGESLTRSYTTALNNKLLTMVSDDVNEVNVNLGVVDGLLLQSSAGTVSMNPQNGISVNQIASNTLAPLNMASDTQFAGQTTFNLAPHCNVDPSTAEDLANKSYVDSRLVNSGSGTNLYFNYSVSDIITPYKQLGTSIVITTQTTINTPQAGTQFIASFITDLGYPGTTTIPSGIWELNQFGRQVGGSGGVLRYYFTLSTINILGGITLLGTSGYSADINTSVTDIFFAQLPLGILTLLNTERLFIEIYSLGTGTGVGHTLDSQFQAGTYSYVTTPLVSGSNFLSLNNVFTGSNSFTNAITMPTMAYPNNTTNGANTAYLTANYVNNSATQTIGGAKTFNGSVDVPTAVFPNSTSIAVNGAYLTANYVPNSTNTTIAGLKTFSNTRTDFNLLSINGNQLNVLNASNTLYLGYTSNVGIINIGENQLSGEIKIGNDSRSGNINIGCGLLVTSDINIGVSTGTSTIGIGSVSKAVTINGSTIGFNVFPTCSATDPISTTSNNTLCTTNFVQTVINYLKTSAAANNWTNVNSFTSILCDNFNASLISSVCEIAQILTTGTLNICKNLTTGGINIGTATSPVKISSLAIVGNQINNTDPTAAINLAQSSTTGNLNLGNQQTSGIIQIGNNPNRLNTSTISIGSGLASLSPIKIGSNTGATTIEIGNAAKTVTILGSATSAITTGTLTVNAVNLPTTFTAPTLNQLGYTISAFTTSAVNVAASPASTIILSFALPVGVWSCSYVLRMATTGTTTITSMATLITLATIPSGTPVYLGSCNTNSTNVFNGIVSYSGSGVYTITTANTLQLYGNFTYTSTGVMSYTYNATSPYCQLTATRIA